MELGTPKKTLVYALHSGNLYGTEQMALATCDALRHEFDAVVFAPEGLAAEEAARMNFAVETFADAKEFARKLKPILAANDELFFIATGIVHSFVLIFLNLFYRRKIRHLHVVHGGADERLSYGRKRLLNFFNVTFVAVSGFVKERLIAHRVRKSKIEVIENFLPAKRVAECPKRMPFFEAGIENVVVISRIDPMKKIDLLLDMLDSSLSLSKMDFTIFGTGADYGKLKTRAESRNKNVRFAGFQSNIAEEISKADLLLHLCPTEPFGLAIIEAFAARVPVLVPNAGGAGLIVTNGYNGFHFRADDATDLKLKLSQLRFVQPEIINKTTESAFETLNRRFSVNASLANYRRLLFNENSKSARTIEKRAITIQ